jgi:hypothetical protein
MAHFAKYTAAAAGHLSKHYERAKDKNGDYIKFGNKDIDTDRTPENYNLAPDRSGACVTPFTLSAFALAQAICSLNGNFP